MIKYFVRARVEACVDKSNRPMQFAADLGDAFDAKDRIGLPHRRA